MKDKLYYAGNSGMYPWGWWHNEHWAEAFMETRVQDSWIWHGDVWDVKTEWSIE